MKQDEFTAFLNAIRPGSDSASKVWWEWAKELESYDSSHGEKPEGSYKTTEMFLDEFAGQIAMAQKRHGNEIAGQVISLAEIPACPFPWEMKAAAEHLANGGDIHDIPQMELEGTLEDFSDSDPAQDMGMQM